MMFSYKLKMLAKMAVAITGAVGMFCSSGSYASGGGATQAACEYTPVLQTVVDSAKSDKLYACGRFASWTHAQEAASDDPLKIERDYEGANPFTGYLKILNRTDDPDYLISQVSDYIRVTYDSSDDEFKVRLYSLGMEDDFDEGVSGTLRGTITETGAWQSVGNYFNFADANAIQFYSDVNVAVIPEPEIYAMLAAGLGLMGFVARRRKQQLAAA